MTFQVRDYWPRPGGQTLAFDYRDAAGKTQFVTHFKCAGDDLLYVDFDAAGNWLDTWYLRETVNGLVEWRDDVAVSGWRSAILGPRKSIVYKPSKGIIWGGRQSVGDTIAAQVEIDHAASNTFPPFKGAWSFGWQQVAFTALHETFATIHGDTFRDVLEFDYVQPWGAKIAGAKYLNARGIGPVQIHWLALINGSPVMSDPVAADPYTI